MEFNPVPIGSCSKENQIIYQQFFNYADSDGDGRITGSDATKFFAMSNLSRQDLKQVWLLLIQSDKDLLVLQSSSLLCSQPITQELLSSGVELKNLKWLSFQIMKC
ncbi:hypothetical protein AHAS_Ahas10G0162500 [Arachis hypogaea]